MISRAGPKFRLFAPNARSAMARRITPSFGRAGPRAPGAMWRQTRGILRWVRRVAIGLLFTTILAAQGPARVDFGRDIQPIFKQHCVECHGPSQQMRGLRLDRRRDALPNRVGANNVRIVPGDAAKSTLYRRIRGTESGTSMPPSGPLKPEEIKLIGDWIDQGAEWPDALSGEVDAAPPDPAVVRMRDALRTGDRRAFERLLAENPGAVNGK